MITVVLTFEVPFLGVATAASIGGPGSRRSRIAATGGFKGPLLAGADIGTYFLSGVSSMGLHAFMSFGVAALFYLVTENC